MCRTVYEFSHVEQNIAHIQGRYYKIPLLAARIIELYLNTVKPRPEAQMDMILFEVFLKNIHLIPQDQIVQ